MLIYGINPVLEALRARRVTALRVSPRADSRVRQIEQLAAEQGVPVRRVGADEIERAAGGPASRHQGVVAEVGDAAGPGGPGVSTWRIWLLAPPRRRSSSCSTVSRIPHNLGAILRTVDAAGADGVVRQSRHAAPLGGATAKASAGAVAHVRVAEVVNIARSLEALKEAGVWTIGLAGDGPTRYDEIDYTLPTALVVGSEGTGLRRLVRERCDWVVSIPMGGHVQSVNVSVATADRAVRGRPAAPEPGGRLGHTANGLTRATPPTTD